MGVAGGEGLVVPDEHVVAPGPVVLGGDDLSRLGRHDGGAVAGADIQAVVGTVEVHIPKVAGNAPHPHAGQGPNGRKSALQAGSDRLYTGAAGGLCGALSPSEPPFWTCWFCNACWRFSSSCRLRSAMRGLQLGLELRVLGLVGRDLLLGLGLLAFQAGHQEVVLLIEDLQLVLGGLNGLLESATSCWAATSSSRSLWVSAI